MSVKLLQYQKIPVQHLLDKCLDQKGLLVWHAMGTGKSFTGLSMISTIQRSKILLMLPENLLDVWKAEGHKLGIDISDLIKKGRIEVIVYELGTEFFNVLRKIDISKFVLIADECHNLIRLIRHRDNTKSYENIALLRGFKKMLLLTGTPMYEDESDLRFLVNIAAGKVVLPMNTDQFQREYFKTSIWRSVFIGWMLSFLSSFLYQSRDLVNAALNYDMILRGRESTANKFYSTLVKGIRVVLYSVPLSAAVAVLIPALIPMILLWLIRLAVRSQADKIRYMDAKKVALKIQSYVSFYNVPSSLRGSDYPSIIERRKPINYDAEQIDLWLRLAQGKLTSSEMVMLGVSKSIGEADFMGDVTQMDDFKYFGRAIGNMSIKNTCPKFAEIEKSMTDPTGKIIPSVIYSNYDHQGARLFARFLKTRNISHKYFTPSMSYNVKQKALRDFKNNKISVLILHFSFVEGISISGARQMHILEPISNQAVFEQVTARVARYGSHTHLPVQERNVTIYQWIAVASSFYARLIKFGTNNKLWAKHQSYVGPWFASSRFGYDLTPDGLVETRNKLFNDNKNQLIKGLQNTNVATLRITSEPNTCRLATEDNELPLCQQYGGNCSN